MSKIAVLGFGNPIKNDDAVGCYVIDELTAFYMHSRWVTLFDMGTSAYEMLDKLKGHSHVILIDETVDSDEPTGTIFKLSGEEAISAVNGQSDNPQEVIKWDWALSYAKKTLSDDFPERVDVYLVAVDSDHPDLGMPEEVEQAGKELVMRIRRTIAEFGL